MKASYNYIIISGFFIPDNGAQANRILCFARGLKSLGCSVTILVTQPGPEQVPLQDMHYEGIDIHYLSKKTYQNKIANNLNWILSLLKIPGLLGSLKSKTAPNIIMLQSEHVSDKMAVWASSKTGRFKTITDISEYPYFLTKTNLSFRQRLKYKLNFHLDVRMFDGISFISNYIRSYFNQTRPIKNSIIIPIIVDTTRFSAGTSLPARFDFPYIAYCGTMYEEKDGVDILVDAFSAVVSKFPDIRLVLIGDTREKEKLQKLYDQIDRLKLTGKVVFTGMVGRDQMPSLLQHAGLLLLSRPNNKQAEGGLPTKLAEYLATGNAVVVTNVGEISLYVHDGESCYLAEPDNRDSFAQKIMLSLSDNEKRKAVGSNGQKLVHADFNYIVQAGRLVDFTTVLLSRGSN